jgi:hypothetical protein
LLQRAFGIEVLVCPKCSGTRRVLAAIHDPGSIARVLGAMGLSAALDLKRRVWTCDVDARAVSAARSRLQVSPTG